MTRTIALTQFVFIALGTLAVTILAKVRQPELVIGSGGENLRLVLAANGVWLLIFPVLWMVYGVAAEVVDRGAFRRQIADVVGIIICVALFLLYGYAVIFAR